MEVSDAYMGIFWLCSDPLLATKLFGVVLTGHAGPSGSSKARVYIFHRPTNGLETDS